MKVGNLGVVTERIGLPWKCPLTVQEEVWVFGFQAKEQCSK